jgi:hypothetical protein
MSTEENTPTAGEAPAPVLPHKGGMDMHDLAEGLLIEPTSPSEDTTTEDKVTEPKEPQGHDPSLIENDEAEEEVETVAEGEQESGEADEADETEDSDAEESDESERAEGEGEDDTESAEADDPVYTTPDGESVNLDELKRGYLRQSDYTRKTQELAQGRQQVQEAAGRIGEYETEVAKNLELALNVIEPQLAAFASTDWESLASQDAYAYAEQRALFDQAQARYGQLTAAAQQTVESAKAQREYQRQQMVAQEKQKLQMALPDLADPKEGRKMAAAIKEYALSSGLSEEEAGNIVDHRLIVMLNKARMYDELNASTLTASKKKVQKGPKKVIKAGQPQTRAEKKAAGNKQLRAKLAATGDVDDAVAYLLSGQ